jgi:hypothetical protein
VGCQRRDHAAVNVEAVIVPARQQEWEGLTYELYDASSVLAWEQHS